MESPEVSTPVPGAETESLAEFDAAVAAGSLAGLRVQSFDLTGRSAALPATDTSGAVLLGCRMEPAAAEKVRADGAFVFPPVPGLPFDPYRGLLYSPDALYDGVAGAVTRRRPTPAPTAGSCAPARTAMHSPRCCARSTTTRSPTRWANSSSGRGWSESRAATRHPAAAPRTWRRPTSAMVLVGRDHWTRELPAWPLLRALAKGRTMESRITLVDTVEEAPGAPARLSTA